MAKRYWIAAFAIGLAVEVNAIAKDELESSTKGETTSETRQEKLTTTGDQGGVHQLNTTSDLVPSLDRIESAIRDLIDEKDEAQRRQQADREQRDLAAQEEMATWAYWMFWATATTVILTFIALLAVVRTLHHTRRAADYAADMVKEAKETTAAAYASVEATREIGRAQVRAYVTCTDMEYAISKHLIRITIRISNTGASPARHVAVGGSLEHSSTGSDGVTTRHRVWFNNHSVPDVAGSSSGESIIIIHRATGNADHFAGLWKNRSHLNFYCTLDWEDVFKSRQSIEFVFGNSLDDDKKFFGSDIPFKMNMRGFMRGIGRERQGSEQGCG